MIEYPEYKNRRKLFDFLVENKDRLIAAKKAEMKRADPVDFQPLLIPDFGVQKADAGIITGNVQVKVIINTTNLFDSHKDVHFPGMWNKSIKDNKGIMHLQEHDMSFRSIISDGADLKTYTREYGWAELGYNYTGRTEALTFDSLIRPDRNSFMAEQYAKGYVRQHSVGMIYVKMILCIGDENYGAEFEAWGKYYPDIANQKDVDEVGFFWAVREAKLIEGSAVPRGSNWATPTISVEEQKRQPLKDTGDEPPEGTRKIDYNYLTKNLKFN